MAYELKPNQGTLHATKAKLNPKAPDYFGELLINLNDAEVDGNVAKVKLGGWKTKAASGATYLSLKVDNYKGGASSPKQENTIEDDEIPF